MHSINGIGTTLYGKTDVNSQDGSYVATEWFIFLLLPIFPLGSYRVWRGGTKAEFLPLPGSNTEYRTTEVKLNWKQVIKTYLTIWGIFISAIFLFIWFLI